MSDAEKSPKDRRRQPRVKPAGLVPVRIVVDPDESNVSADQPAKDGHLMDTNHLGAYVATDLKLERGTLLRLELVVPGETLTRSIRAKVARSKDDITDHRDPVPVGLGVEFITTSEAEESMVQDTVNAILTLELLGYGNRRHYEDEATDTVIVEPA